ncbi:Zn(II)2Cys6 transcription factor [Sporobolomyces salmoneus]|uniref:Zn(II)2Cys6 transcription factor n=1 Tax=Sporobolomyces salmoneus TaxID=183962 RepID=UPI00317B7F10
MDPHQHHQQHHYLPPQHQSYEHQSQYRVAASVSGNQPPQQSTSSSRKRSADQLDEEDEQVTPEVKEEDSPAAAGGSTPAKSGNSQRKNRSAAPPLKRGNACTLCRKRKLRCDGVKPKCATCLRLSHECVYGDPAQERTKELEERIRSLEAELENYRRSEAATPAPDQASTSTSTSATRARLLDGSQFGDLSTSTSTPNNRPQHDRSASFPSLNMPGGDDQTGEFSSSINSQFPGFPSQPFPSASTHHPPPPAHQPHTLESPYLYNVDPPRAHSEAFPLPPPHSIISTNNANVNGTSTSPTMIPQAHLQSFPFPMNPTPQLSDLINPQHFSPVAAANYQPNGSGSAGGGGVEDGSPGSLHQISPVGGTTSTLANDFGGFSSIPSAAALTAANLAAQSPPSAMTGRHPFDGQSALASPDRNGISLGGLNGLNGMDQKQQQDGELSTIWSAAELPEIDLMVELANIYFATIHQHLPFLHRPRFLYTLRHPASLSSPPSLSLIFAVLAVAAAYHDSPQIRAQQTRWYNAARAKVEVAIQAGVRPSGGRIASLTVEMVQALTLLALLEMGQSDHQRAFLSIGQAVRIAAMLGLHRMDEDRLSERCGTSGDKRLRPPALHELPIDGVLLEECRRTMCAVFVIDRFEQGCVGWPSAIAEPDLRILLPCDEALYETGLCSSDDNPLWWPPEGLEAEDAEASKPGNERKRVGTFAWLCRAAWVGGRVQLETYRPSGPPASGPWNKNVAADPLFTTSDMLEMDKLLDFVRSKLGQLAAMKATQHKGVDGPVIMTLLVVNCLLVNLHHLRASTGLQQLPFDPTAPIFIGTAEYSLQRCWEAIHSLYEIVSQLAGYENSRTSLHRSRINTFTSFVPYVLYCVAFPAKYTIGDWTALVNSRDRTENVPAHSNRPGLLSGDDVFPPSYFEQRLNIVDALCDAMERVGAVWPIGHKFATMVSGDRIRLAERTYQRDHAPPQAQQSSSNGTGGGGSNQNTPVSQSSQHLHPRSSQQSQQNYHTSPTLHSDSGY